MSLSPCLQALAAVLLAALCLSSLAAAQPYTPVPSSLSCPSGQTAVTLGSTVVSSSLSSYYSTLSAAFILVSAVNSSGLNGASLSQLSLALGDNTGLTQPVHLILGVYSFQVQSASTAGGVLAAQTAEITLYPSPPQTLYASLLLPLTLTSSVGVQYGLAVWADRSFTVGQGAYGGGYYGSSTYGIYSDYSLPNYLSMGLYVGASMAASGCINPNEFSGGSSAVYAFCAYSASYSPGQPNSIYSTAVSTVTSMTGLITVSKNSPTTTSFGTGYTVTGLSGSLTQSVSGSNAVLPSMRISSNSVQLGGGKLGSPSNLLYLSGPAAVDSGGLSVTLDTGVQVLLQGSSSGAISFTASTPSAVAAQSLYVGSAFVLTAETASSTSASCPVSPYVPDPPVACPAGQVAISYGDTNLAAALVSSDFESFDALEANYVYFTPFLATAPSTVITTLSYYVLANPGDAVHLRLGLFLTNGSTASPTYVLLQQSAQVTLVNIGNQLVSANLPAPVPLTQGGNYAIGIWADQSIFSPFNEWEPVFVANIPYSSVSSTGAFPAVIPGLSSYANVPTAASGCTAGSTSQVSFCAAFNYVYTTRVYTGLLTVLNTVFTNSQGSYRVVISGNGSTASGASWILNGFQYPTPNRLYDPATSQSGSVLDSAGLQIVWSLYSEPVSSTLLGLAPSSASGVPVYSYTEAIEYVFGSPNPQANAGATVTWAPYTGGAIPTCSPPVVTGLNLVVPASVSRLLCPASSSLLTFGDPVIFDYANYREGNAVSAGLVYTNGFTGQAGAVVSQLAVDLLSNVNSPPIGLQLGLYLASSGALLASSGPITLLQTVDQQVVVALASPVTLTAAQYYLALTANASLSIATGSAQSATMTSSGGGLPGTFTASGTTAGVVPVLALGCLPASYSFCSWFQYYTPGSTPSTSTFLYSGLLTLGSGPSSSSFGSYYSVSLASAYLSVYTRLATSTTSSVTLFDTLVSPAGGSGRIYVSGVAALDLSGLQLYSASRAVTVTLSYSGNASFVDSSAAAWVAPLTSNFSVAPTGGSGGSIPQCGVLSLPTVNIGLAPAPSCPAGQTVVSFDDDVGADYGNVVEEVYYGSNSYIIMRQFTAPPSNVSTSITQLGWGLNKNFNVLGHARFALYDTNLNFLAQSNEVTYINPVDQAIVGALSPAYSLSPSGVYYIAVWMDVSLYSSFSYIYVNTPCNSFQYSSSAAWPSPFVSAGDCGMIALGAYGCTAPALTPSPAFSSSTGGSGSGSNGPNQTSSTCTGGGSSGSNLSNGAIAGIVIGCSIGLALLTAVCILLCFGSGVFGNRKASSADTTQDSRHEAQRLEESSRVEMTGTESSQINT